MTQGLQTFNLEGKLILDYTEPINVLYGTGHTGLQAGKIIDSNIDEDTFIAITNLEYYNENGTIIKGTGSSYFYATLYCRCPIFKINVGEISWTLPPRWTGSGYTSGIVDVTFAYGGNPK